ncbi:MAG: 5-(carboxyamino)imidazole ribonucleotide mutase [Acidobacteriota bacterium]|nr:5-(carboxyamino)imidazole ribonucleotide mutase [Acidobacteriota bacterium]MDQ7088822.1 5-(carboxyamino)imidazole ribonucleotide mutase [Acidobacteriota bacterium]
MSDSPRVMILMGSASDLDVMRRAARELAGFGVPFDLEITSAHRTPERTVEIIRRAEAKGVEVFIVGAGMAAHLAGVVAAHTSRPVLGVPLAGPLLDGLDALLSTVQMPRGVPVATLAVGGSGATNAALLAVQILALSDPRLAERLAERRRSMAEEVEQASRRARESLDADAQG